MPERANYRKFAQTSDCKHVHGVGIEHRVVPLMADREESIGIRRGLDHRLTLADCPRISFFAQDVFAGFEAIDRDRSMRTRAVSR